MHEFEEYIYPLIRREFPAFEGWTIESQKRISEGRMIADWVAYRGNERAIIECKDKNRLIMEDIDQVIRYAGAYRASYIFIYISNRTEVNPSVKQYAYENNVTIRRTQWFSETEIEEFVKYR